MDVTTNAPYEINNVGNTICQLNAVTILNQADSFYIYAKGKSTKSSLTGIHKTAHYAQLKFPQMIRTTIPYFEKS
jgi:hypothetical protein